MRWLATQGSTCPIRSQMRSKRLQVIGFRCGSAVTVPSAGFRVGRRALAGAASRSVRPVAAVLFPQVDQALFGVEIVQTQSEGTATAAGGFDVQAQNQGIEVGVVVMWQPAEIVDVHENPG